MTDPTLATVDDEPWNQSPAEQRRRALAERRKVFTQNAPVLAIEAAYSIHQRILHGIAILTATGAHAEYVYDAISMSNEPEPCERCGATTMSARWHEFVYAPHHASHGRKYIVVRMFYLCNRHSSALKRLPLGERWKGPK